MCGYPTTAAGQGKPPPNNLARIHTTQFAMSARTEQQLPLKHTIELFVAYSKHLEGQPIALHEQIRNEELTAMKERSMWPCVDPLHLQRVPQTYAEAVLKHQASALDAAPPRGLGP